MDNTAGLIYKKISSSNSICSNPDAAVVGIAPMPKTHDGLKADILYYGTDSEFQFLSPASGNFLVLAEGSFSPDFSAEKINCAFFSNQKEYQECIASLEGYFADAVRLTGVLQTMAEIVQSTHDLHQLLEYTYSIVQNPIMVSDVSFNYIDSVGTGSLPEEPVWEYAIENKSFPEVYVSSLIGRFFENQQDSKHRLLMVDGANTNGLKHTQYSASMIQGGNIFGFVKLLDYNKHPSEFDIDVLRVLAVYSCVLVENSGLSSLNNSLNENFIEAIICGRISSPDEIRRKQTLLNLKLFDNLFLISVIPKSSTPISNENYYLYKELRGFFIGCNVVVLKNHFVVLFDQKNPVLSEDFLGKFSAFLKTNECVANISLSFTKFEDLPRYYEQTLFCNEMRTLLGGDIEIVTYEDVYCYHMISDFGKKVDLKTLIHPALNLIIKEDESSSGNLLDTLFTFLDNQCNIATTSKAMNVHYNTTKNRVQRIIELTSLNLDDSKTRFRLRLSQMILKILEN